MMDRWIENNCPKNVEFNRDFVKYLMKLAYEEGRASELEKSKPRKIMEIIGPYDIPD